MIVRGRVENAIAFQDSIDLQEYDFAEIEEEAREALDEYGVDLVYFCLEERAQAKALRLFGIPGQEVRE